MHPLKHLERMILTTLQPPFAKSYSLSCLQPLSHQTSLPPSSFLHGHFSSLATLLSHSSLIDIGQKFFTHLFNQHLLISSYNQRVDSKQRATLP